MVGEGRELRKGAGVDRRSGKRLGWSKDRQALCRVPGIPVLCPGSDDPAVMVGCRTTEKKVHLLS